MSWHHRAAIACALAFGLATCPSSRAAPPPAAKPDHPERWLFGDWVFEEDWQRLVATFGKDYQAKLKALLSTTLSPQVVGTYDKALESTTLAANADAASAAVKVDAAVRPKLAKLRDQRNKAAAAGDEVEVLRLQNELWDAFRESLSGLDQAVTTATKGVTPKRPDVSEKDIASLSSSFVTLVLSKASIQSKDLTSTLEKAARWYIEEAWNDKAAAWRYKISDELLGQYRAQWLAIVKPPPKKK